MRLVLSFLYPLRTYMTVIWLGLGASGGFAFGPQPSEFSRTAATAEAYGQGLWWSARISHRFHYNFAATVGFSYLEVPPVASDGQYAKFGGIPVSVSAFIPLGKWWGEHFFEMLAGGNVIVGSTRTERTGVRATLTGQSLTPLIGFGYLYWPDTGGLVLRFSCYLFQGIDAQGFEHRRLPWLGGSVGYAF
jgi:hypothetical protein